MRRQFGRENGDRRVLGADTYTHDESNGEQLLPSLSEPGSDGGSNENDTGNEYFTSSPKIVIEGIDDKSTNKTTSVSSAVSS